MKSRSKIGPPWPFLPLSPLSSIAASPVCRWPLIKLSFAPCQAARATPLPAAQSLHDLHGIIGGKGASHIEGLLAIDEEANMRPHPVLLVDHAESEARIKPVEIGEELADCGAVGVDLPLSGVGMQRRGYQHLHGRSIISRRPRPRRFRE